ncbi:uncharacterized protein [Nicotiana sylvestris]|uniref:uncharacterized protein n=1 Tax=Nicotiana sylvestris TaxID=4096 RepID=UPI00388CD449
MVAAWGESSYEDSEDKTGDKQTFMAIGESDDEQEVSVIHLKDKIKFFSKEKLSELLLDFIDESEVINNEKEQLSRECVILKAKCKNLEFRASESDRTGKKKADHTHLTLEENLGKMKDELYKRDEQIRVLKEDLGKVKHELDRTCKWNNSSDALSWLQDHHSCNKKGLGYGTPTPKWDPKSKYITLLENKICTHCGKTGHYKSECNAKEKASQKNKIYVEGKNMYTLIYMWAALRGRRVDSTKQKIIASDIPLTVQVKRSSQIWCMTRPHVEKTLYELLKGRKSNISHLRAFGSKCFVHNNGNDSLGKFDPRSDEGVFLGYSSHRKAYKMYNKRTLCGEESVHMVFDETNILSKRQEHEDEAIGLGNLIGGTKQRKSESNSQMEPVHKPVPQKQNMGEAPNRNQLVVKPYKYQSSHPIENILTDPTSGVKTRSQLKNMCDFDSFLSLIEPKNVAEALQDVDWVNAMQDELNQFEKSQVWHLVTRPKDISVIGTR